MNIREARPILKTGQYYARKRPLALTRVEAVTERGISLEVWAPEGLHSEVVFDDPLFWDNHVLLWNVKYIAEKSVWFSRETVMGDVWADSGGDLVFIGPPESEGVLRVLSGSSKALDIPLGLVQEGPRHRTEALPAIDRLLLNRYDASNPGDIVRYLNLESRPTLDIYDEDAAVITFFAQERNLRGSMEIVLLDNNRYRAKWSETGPGTSVSFKDAFAAVQASHEFVKCFGLVEAEDPT